MTMNPVLVNLFEKYGTSEAHESDVKQAVRREVHHSAAKAAEDRARWFNSYSLPKASVLARLSPYDREALIAHFYAKELRKIADARHERNDYQAGLANKRLDRVKEVAEAFAEVRAESYWAA